MTADAAVQRAFAMICAVPRPGPEAPADAGNRPIAYRQEDSNGGRDPYAPHCADWSYGLRTPTSDCVGLVLWCSGVDRLQPSYQGSRGPWLNQNSLLDDADGAKNFCSPIADHDARAGDWLATEDHIGIIVRPAIYAAGKKMFDHRVIDCSPRHGRATAIGLGGPWSTKCRVLRYRHYQP